MKLAYANALYLEPLEVSCARAAAAGYDGIEVFLDDRALTERHQIRSTLDSHGLAFAAGGVLMSAEREIVHPDPDVRAAASAYLIEAVELVAQLGGAVLTIAPGADGRLKPWSTPDQERAWCVEALGAAQAVGNRQGVRIAIEPICRFETCYVNRAEQALSIAEEIGPNCGVLLDVFHMYLEERDPLATIEATAERIVSFHVAEHNRLPPGFGVVPWKQVIATLVNTGYDDYLTLEFAAPEAWREPEDGEQTYAAAIGKAVQVLRGCLSGAG